MSSRRARITLLAAVVLLIAAELYIVLPEPTVVILVSVASWFALPGVVLAYRGLGSTTAALRSAWLIGPALGFAFSVFGLLLVWAAGLQNWIALLVAPLFTLALAMLARRFGGVQLRLPAVDRRDVIGVACALLVVPLITFGPYDQVRADVDGGDAYRAYFTADFVWAMTVTSELSKGDVPPANPFLAGEPLRYYWMSHLLSGATYRTVQRWGIGTEPVVLINGLAFGLAFVGFLYWLARSAGASAMWAAVAVIVGFVANSYEGADMIRAIVARGDSWNRLRDTNIDAVTRWFYSGMAVDGLQRLLLYQPHHLTGYVCALSAAWLTALADKVDDISIALWTGILLGMAFLFSTFSAILMGPAIALIYAVRLLQQGAVRWTLHCVLLGAGPLAIGISLAQTLGYTNPADGLLLEVGPNPVALRNWPLVLFLSFGPLLLVGFPGMLRLSWVKHAGTAPAALVASALAFYFLIDVPDMGGVWVGWRSGHMLLIAFTVISAATLTACWPQRGAARLLLGGTLMIAVLLATPTVAIDVYNAQDVTNRGMGVNFPWTLVISRAEREGLDWIRTNTPASAVVQPEPHARDAGTWAYVPAFGQRRMAAGLPISMIPMFRYQRLSQVVRAGIFTSATAEEAHATAVALGIDYLLIGDAERRAYRSQTERLKNRSDLFDTVFQNDAMTVLEVMPYRDASSRQQ